MIRRTEKLLITFYTTTDAMAMENLCKEYGMPGRIIPVPGDISADCGLGWCAGLDDKDILTGFMGKYNLNFQDIHRCLI